MAMNVGSPDGEEDELNSTINTTPLVDVMLVLLIIFLITIPVVTKPENINISVDREGGIYWNDRRVADVAALYEKMRDVATMDPQPEVHIRGDADVRYEFVGRVVFTCQKAGIVKVGFITEPPARG